MSSKPNTPEANATASAPKKPGVIATIVKAMTDNKVTKEQILARLVKTFPERAEDGMKTTVNIQCKRLRLKHRIVVTHQDGKTYYYIKGGKDSILTEKEQAEMPAKLEAEKQAAKGIKAAKAAKAKAEKAERAAKLKAAKEANAKDAGPKKDKKLEKDAAAAIK